MINKPCKISSSGFVLNKETFIFLVSCIKLFLIVAIAILLISIAIKNFRYVLHMMQNGASANNSASAGGFSGGNNNDGDDKLWRIIQKAAENQAKKRQTKARKKGESE